MMLPQRPKLRTFVLPRWGPYPLSGPKTISGKIHLSKSGSWSGRKSTTSVANGSSARGMPASTTGGPASSDGSRGGASPQARQPEDQRGSSLVHAKSPHPDASGCVASRRSLTLVSAASKVSCPKLPVQW